MSKVEYKNTLNLPQTDFSMKADLVNKEPETQKFWDDLNIYSKLIENRKGAEKFVLHDGPPYANGDIHIGHALNKLLKDIILKYKAMKGFQISYIPGWDCHGLPIEHQVTKNLKNSDSKSKLEIRKLCKEYAEKYVNIQKEEFKRLGILGQWDDPYLTMNYDYEADILKVFKILVEKGYVEKRLKPIYWCSHCRTALAEAEVEYDNHTSPSVYVKFPVISDIKKFFPEISSKKTSMLIWTTTPWTLPANMAIAVHRDFDYIALEMGDEVLVFAEKLFEQIAKKKEIADCKVLGKIKGRNLEGLCYSHPFMERESKVILADFVTDEDGTGCVHIAPGHGEDDYRVGMEYKLEVFTPVNHKGEFTSEVPLFEGQKVFDANKNVIAKLEELGCLFGKENISHSYPHCWRCKKPIIFRATEQWFIVVDKNNLRKKVLDIIEEVNWVPSWGKTRITDMVAGRPDWCISRQRSWGVPIPVVYCEDCGVSILDIKIIDNVISLVKQNGCDIWFEKDISEILPKGFKCKCGSAKFIKEYDILDVWFDSGVSHTAVVKANNMYPADLYLEGSDQHRGWFQSSIFTAVAAYDNSPFKTVLTHGFVVDGEGKKMSKSMGNVVSPLEVIKKSGADILRLWVSSADYTEDVKVSDEILTQRVDAYRKIRNTCRFLLANISDFDLEKNSVGYDDMLEIDRLALSRLNNFVKRIDDYYDKYQFHRVYKDIYYFCTVDMSSFYLDILKDRMYTFAKNSLARRSGQTVMLKILDVLTRVMAPVLAFTAEEIWKYLPGNIKSNESIHLADWPCVDEKYISEELESKWKKLEEIRNEVLKSIEVLRNSKVLGSSLEAEVKIIVGDEALYELLFKYEKELPMIFIVSKVVLEKNNNETIKISVSKVNLPKCVRCWNYSETVGKNEEHPEICSRCLDAIMEDGLV
ncbi:isoleucine--tRNA ligase [bacterium]|nr:isoleucine--tRNA ligase [bacterium]